MTTPDQTPHTEFIPDNPFQQFITAKIEKPLLNQEKRLQDAITNGNGPEIIRASDQIKRLKTIKEMIRNITNPVQTDLEGDEFAAAEAHRINEPINITMPIAEIISILEQDITDWETAMASEYAGKLDNPDAMELDVAIKLAKELQTDLEQQSN